MLTPILSWQKYQTDSIDVALMMPDNRLGPAIFERLKTFQMMQQKMDTKESII